MLQNKTLRISKENNDPNILYFRNRLENNSDHWNALFLSLRELAEWTVKKESELESMSPIGGDEATIRKQQVRMKNLFLLKIILALY